MRDKERFPYTGDDLRYKKREKRPAPQAKAVVFFLMDTSGSMTRPKLMITRVINGRFLRFLRMKYDSVDSVFVVHESIAKEVTEDQFFRKEGSGGTHFSSGYEKVIEIIKARYPLSTWNIYVIHSTDGENFSEDNRRAVEFLKELLKIVNLFAYYETTSGTYVTNIKVFEPLKREFDNFKTFKVKDVFEAKKALEEFLKDE